MMISARNQIDGVIAELRYGPVSVLLELQTANGTRMSASVSTMSAEAMQLQQGDRIVAFFQASHVLIATGWAMGISARNKLPGIAEQVRMGAVNAEIVVRLEESKDRISAVITNEAVRELELKDGDEVVVIVKASDVMVAK